MKSVLTAVALILGLATGIGSAQADPLASCLPRVAGQTPRPQIQFGTLSCANGMMTAVAGPKQNGMVGKAAAIVPFGPIAKTGTVVTVRTQVFIPKGKPVNSIHLMDLECKYCGLAGNPGLRLYLRDGRLRIDRAKIGVRSAWVNDRAPRIPTGQWVNLEWTLGLSDRQDGWARVRMNGKTVLKATGRTVPLGKTARGVDRLQLGVTANSNATAATAHFRNATLALTGRNNR